MRIETLSVIPQCFDSYMSSSIMKNASEAGVFEFISHDLHDWTHDNYRKVDDRPFGGGAGQVMMAAPIFEAVSALSAQGPKPHVVFFTPTGTPFNQSIAQDLAQKERILFVCGRYEGMDERVYSLADQCISLGDYVLTGGELAAMVVTDAVVRLLPGALGNDESSVDESFSTDGLLEYAQYTRPANYEGMEVPEVLLSGNHGAVDAWRRANAIERTAQLRPDLLKTANLTPQEREFASKVLSVVDSESAPQDSQNR